MKTVILFFSILFSLNLQAQKKYHVSRFEETATSLFISLNSDKTPSYIEHSFSSVEMATAASRKATIERLVAELELKDELYQEPLRVTYKEKEDNAMVVDTANVRKAKVKIRLKQKTEKDSIAKVELLKLQPQK